MAEILTGLWTTMELCGIQLLENALFHPRSSKKRRYLCLVVVWVCSQIVLTFHPVVWVKLATFGIFFASFSLLNYEDAWYQHLLLIAIWMAVMSAIDNVIVYGAAILLNVSVSDLSQSRLLYALTVTSAKSIEVYISWLIYHFRREQTLRGLRGKWLVFAVLFSLFSVITLYSISYGFRDVGIASFGVLLLSVATIMVTLILLYLICSLAAATEQLQESSLLFQQVELQGKQIQALELSNRTQRDLAHDFRNHLQVIDGLLATGESRKAQDVIEDLLGGTTSRIFAVNTHNPILDALLNQKYQEARSEGVEMQLRVNDLSNLPLPEDMMIVLLSNLLDNAVEGSLRTGAEVYKEVLVTLVREEDTVFLAVQNPSLPVELRNGRCETSKPDKINHGYGLGKINTILKMLQASSSLHYTDGQFCVAAEIPLNT